MNLAGVLLAMCVVVPTVLAGWLSEIISSRGIDLGQGISLHVDNKNRDNNATFLEDHALRLVSSELGVSVSKNSNKNAVQVDILMNDQVKGRERKVGDIMLPAVIGFKMTGLIALTLTAMAVFVVKALGIAKVALVTSALLVLKKLFHHDEPSYVEIEHEGSERHPVYAEFPSGGEYNPSAANNYYAYANYAPSAAAESLANYATVQAPEKNATAPAQQATPAVATKRRDYSRRNIPIPFLTVRRYTVKT